MSALAPRSTWIHCGSAKALDHRVPGSPSTALRALKAPSVLEAVAGFPCESRVSAARAEGAGRAMRASSEAARAKSKPERRKSVCTGDSSGGEGGGGALPEGEDGGAGKGC